MSRSVEAGRRFWNDVLVAGGSSVLPRRPSDSPADADAGPGVVEHEVALDPDLVAALRGHAGQLAVSLSSMLLAAHARVLAGLCDADLVVVGYVARGAAAPLPCRLDTGCDTWRALLAESFCVESATLTHRAVDIGVLRARLGVAGPTFETVVDPTGGHGEHLPGGVALWVGVAEREDGLVLRLRCRAGVRDVTGLLRIGEDHLRVLAAIAADVDGECPAGPGAPDTNGRSRRRPWTSTEQRVATAWEAVLAIPADRLDRHDDFFDRGGTSMSAVKLAIMLGRAVSLREITAHPTIAGLAGLLRERAPRTHDHQTAS